MSSWARRSSASRAPAEPLVLLLAFLLAVLSAFAVGAAHRGAWRRPRPPPTGWGMSLYFTSLFFAGVWLPLPLMPDAVQTIAGYTPLGAGSQAIAARVVRAAVPDDVAAGHGRRGRLVGIPVAARLFRWS